MSNLARSRDCIPPPPPPPENLCSKIPSSVRKIQTTSPSRFFQSQFRSQNQGPAPTGFYFFYGSLQDPSLLGDLLGPREVAHLRPACIEGYQCKLWGHYPALLSGDPGDRVLGTVYEVPTAEEAEKLAAYEGPSYTTTACSIRYTDDRLPDQVFGQRGGQEQASEAEMSRHDGQRFSSELNIIAIGNQAIVRQVGLEVGICISNQDDRLAMPQGQDEISQEPSKAHSEQEPEGNYLGRCAIEGLKRQVSRLERVGL